MKNTQIPWEQECNGPKNCAKKRQPLVNRYIFGTVFSFNHDLNEVIFVVGSKVDQQIEAARQNPKSPRPLCQRLLQIWQTQGTLKSCSYPQV